MDFRQKKWVKPVSTAIFMYSALPQNEIDLTRYGMFIDKAIVDGRVSSITFKQSSDYNIVVAIPYFWFGAGTN